MILKTQEAKRKFCPLTMSNDMPATSCLGDDCMAWQWEDLGYGGGVAERGFCGMVATAGHNKEQALQPF